MSPSGSSGKEWCLSRSLLVCQAMGRPESHRGSLSDVHVWKHCCVQACAGAWDVTSLGLALSDPFSSPPGKGGERNTYTAFGRDASVGGLTQVRLCL